MIQLAEMVEQINPKDKAVTAEYYASQSDISNPGRFEDRFVNLPHNIEELCKVVRGLIANRDDTQMYGFTIPQDRLAEANTRYIEDILKKIIEMDNSPLTQRREPEKRFIGSCRDFALTLCSMLRHQGTPARLRAGFAEYFTPGKFVDHWVCEYWDKEGQKWTMVDAELGEAEKKKYGIAFDPTDVPRDQFLPGGVVWKMAREGKKDPSLFGVHNIPVNGLWFIRADTLRDLAALNKQELLPWDYTEFFDKQFDRLDELSPDEITLLDAISNVTSNPNSDPKDIQSLYQSNPELQVKGTLRSYLTEQPIEVSLRI